MIDVPASRFRRPVRGAWHERFQFDRIVGQMTAATKTAISAPPLRPTSCSCGQFLDRFATLRDQFGMRSLNIPEVAERVLQ